MRKDFSYRIGQALGVAGVALIVSPLVFGLAVMQGILEERMDNYVKYVTSSSSVAEDSSNSSIADSVTDDTTSSSTDSVTEDTTSSATDDIIEEVPSIDITEEEFELLCRMVAHEVGTQKQFKNGFYPTLSNDEFNNLQRLMASVAINRVKGGYCNSLYEELTDSVQFMTEQELLSVELDDLTKANVWAELCNPLFEGDVVFEQSISATNIELAAYEMESSLNVNIDTSTVKWFLTAEGRYLIFAAPEET